MSTDRRKFLQLLSAGAVTASFPASIARALAIPANNRTGTINDVEHIVFMMQENRSFDHYFGTLRGVRGFGDPRAVTLANGNPVWQQPSGGNNYVLPFHPGAPNLGLQFLEDLAHDWETTHAAWNNGNNDQWVPQKGTTTMAHLTPAATSPTTTPWPMPSPSVTHTTALSSGPPTPTVTTCGPAGSATTARTAAP